MDYENFNLFSGLSWFTMASGAEWFMNLAKLGYNIFYLMSFLFMGFKLVQAAFIWLARSDAVFGHAKQQMLMEILEPVKGLAYFVAGMTFIKIVTGYFI